jgi:hypothetical protein
MTTVQGILKNIHARETGKTHTMLPVTRHADVRPTHKAGAPVRDGNFDGDDITNLIIDLAMAKDVEDFINNM